MGGWEGQGKLMSHLSCNSSHSSSIIIIQKILLIPESWCFY